MSNKQYLPAFKVEVVLEVLREEKELGEIAAHYDLNPNMVRNWKAEFLSKANSIFEGNRKAEREEKRKKEALEQEKAQMLKTIGQLTLECDFLQDCFRRKGYTVPRLDSEKL